MGKLTNRQTHKQTNRQTEIQKNGQTEKPRNKFCDPDELSHIQIYLHKSKALIQVRKKDRQSLRQTKKQRY